MASTVFRLLRALLPLAMLWVSKLIIDGVVAWITRCGGILAGIWKLVALGLALAIPSDVLGRANTLCDSAAHHWCGAARHPGVASDPPGI
jgi:ATP-binding cassette subfamily B protein